MAYLNECPMALSSQISIRIDYRLRVLAMIDEKFKGHEITAAPKPGPVIDLMEALKQSMKKVPEKKTASSRKTQRKA
jgi:non-homologous end joining protein Ku